MTRARLGLLAAALLSSFALSPGGATEGKSAPVLILHDWYGNSPAATPAFIRDNLKFLESQPFDGLAIYVRSPDLTVNVTTSILSDTALTCEQIANVLKPVANLPFKKLRHNFAAVLSLKPPDLFEDWTVVIRNFGFLARAAREAGLKGIYFDNENYGARWADWPAGVAHPGKPLADYQAQARLRGKQVLQAMTAVFPEVVVLSLHGPYISEPKAPAPLFPSWQRTNLLLGPFFSGFVEGAGPRARCVDGGELYHLRTAEEFRRSYDWRKDSLPSDRVNCAYLPAAVRSRWPATVEIAFGVYDRPFGGQGMDPATLKACLAHAFRRTDRYVWLYVEGPSFLLPPARDGAPAPWVDALLQARKDAR